MCDIRQYLRENKGAICFITSYIGGFLFFLSIGFFYFHSSIDFWALTLLILGISMFSLGIITYVFIRLSENFWATFFLAMIFLTVIIGVPIVAMNLIDIEGIKKMQDLYITINLAILSISVAGVTLSKDIVPKIKKNSAVAIKNFKIFLMITTLNLILLVFGYIFGYILSLFEWDYLKYATITLIRINIQTINLFFWVTTLFTIIAISNMVYYTIMIIESAEN